MSVYPGTLDSFVTKVDGPTQKIMAAHINDLQSAIVAVETELGTDPAGSLATLKLRLAVMLTAAGGFIGPQQVVTVAKAGASYTTIQAAINSIGDAASNKIYTVLVFPGFYNEAITLKNYVNIVAIDPYSTFILQQVTDANSEVHCTLIITIPSASNTGLYIQHASSVVTVYGNISSSDSYGVVVYDGTVSIYGNVSSSSSITCHVLEDGVGSITVHGDISSTASNAVYTVNGGSISVYGNISASTIASVYLESGGTIIITNSIITCTFNNALGHGITKNGGTLIVQNSKIVCTHADAKGIYSSAAQDVRCMSVWANRDDHANVTQLIAGGYTHDADVQ